jgi:hypothetical protein
MKMGQNQGFEVGDVVCLNSGSPPMTVVSFSNDDGLVLAYADLNGNMMRESLPRQAVNLTESRWCLDVTNADVDYDDEEEDY